MSDDDELRAELAARERHLPPLAKTRGDALRDELKSKAHAGFVEAIDALLDERWAKRRVADHMGIDIHTLADLYDGKRNLQAWHLAALPARGRMVYQRAMLGWDGTPSSTRSGTHG